ncbi:MAG: RluA family pseudouridine synthase [Candidatus Edwardsbacteria bacterium]|nr:RluA family pseudouridine synthase [Candidatus Edwardsbacteria bacterium]MBU1576215.1 RluA family pseudouridine synthase [Candidatus Edwardsbacteria bacterium]MBU2464139.1 RluA family pseudouridine synthase [Candidatus Edwardsbacteria bacterium]MBU2594371.1 RluA family pseudouridine synthase [Candidatus Edwardsbacteria bacterium]
MAIPSDITVSSQQKSVRLDRYLICQGLNISRNRIQGLIQSGNITVNGQPSVPSYLVRPGDQVHIRQEAGPLKRGRPQAEDIPIEVVFEDRDLMVVNKPAGMVVHPAAGNYSGTLVNALLHHSDQLSDAGDGQRPGILHRLDKDTSGLLLVAKSDQAHAALARQMGARKITRRYQALAWGLMEESQGTINAPIGRSAFDRKKMDVSAIRGRQAVTHYQVLGEYKIASHLELRLETGRTHQIRVHLKHLGHPIVGDVTYGGTGKQVITTFARRDSKSAENILASIGRQALHAAVLGFIHPVTGKYLEFSAPLPDDIQGLIKTLKAL